MNDYAYISVQYTYRGYVNMGKGSQMFSLLVCFSFLCFLPLQVDENGYRMYKHMAVTTVAVVIFSQPPYFLSISPRYNVEYGIYMLNVCLGAVLGVVLCLVSRKIYYYPKLTYIITLWHRSLPLPLLNSSISVKYICSSTFIFSLLLKVISNICIYTYIYVLEYPQISPESIIQ